MTQDENKVKRFLRKWHVKIILCLASENNTEVSKGINETTIILSNFIAILLLTGYYARLITGFAQPT